MLYSSTYQKHLIQFGDQVYLKKILDLGIGGNFYNIVKSMYLNTKCVIKKQNIISEPTEFKIGVKGDDLSPLLFNILQTIYHK